MAVWLTHGHVDHAGAAGSIKAKFNVPIHSIAQKLWPLGKGIQFLPGHGPASTFGEERLDNAFVADSVLGITED